MIFDEAHGISRLSRLVLTFLLLADLGFVGIYLASVAVEWAADFPMYDVADLNGQYSLASSWNYGKYILVAVLLLPLAVDTRRRGLAWIALLVLGLLADDALELHDRIGLWLGEKMDAAVLSPISPQDRGEPLVYGVILLFAITLMVLARRDLLGTWRQVWVRFALAVTALAVLGAGVDVLHGLIKAFVEGETALATLDVGFTVVEDGGEMLAISAILWISFDIVLRHGVEANSAGTPTPSLHRAQTGA